MQPNVATRPKWVNSLDPTFRAIFYETEYKFNSKIDSIFNVINSDKAFEKDSSVSGLSQLEEYGENQNVPYEDASPGWDVTYTHKKYGKATMVSDEMVKDSKWNDINKRPKMLATAKMRTQEVAAADVFNFGFTAGGGGKALFTGGDAQALFSTAHVNRDGTVTQSNKITTALSQTSLQAVITAMRTRRDSKNEVITFEPNVLLVPPALEFTAKAILNSTQVLGSANNDINVLKDSLTLVVWPYLTSTTAWFVIDTSMSELNFFIREDTGVKGPNYDWENDAAKWKTKIRFSVGFSDWMGVYGSDGTT